MPNHAVQRKTKSLYRVLNTPTTLYLDDLEEIVAILTELSPEGLDIEDEEYEYGSLDGVISNAKSPARNLKISTRLSLDTRDSASVEINAADMRVYVSNSRNATRGAFEAVIDILRRRRKPLAWLFSSLYFLRPVPSIDSYFLAFIMEASCFGGLLFGILSATGISTLVAPTALAAGLVAFFLLRAVGSATYYRNEIRLYKTAQASTFWQRNQDTITVTLMGVVAAALFGLLVNSLLG